MSKRCWNCDGAVPNRKGWAFVRPVTVTVMLTAPRLAKSITRVCCGGTCARKAIVWSEETLAKDDKASYEKTSDL